MERVARQTVTRPSGRRDRTRRIPLTHYSRLSSLFVRRRRVVSGVSGSRVSRSLRGSVTHCSRPSATRPAGHFVPFPLRVRRKERGTKGQDAGRTVKRHVTEPSGRWQELDSCRSLHVFALTLLTHYPPEAGASRASATRSEAKT